MKGLADIAVHYFYLIVASNEFLDPDVALDEMSGWPEFWRLLSSDERLALANSASRLLSRLSESDPSRALIQAIAEHEVFKDL